MTLTADSKAHLTQAAQAPTSFFTYRCDQERTKLITIVFNKFPISMCNNYQPTTVNKLGKVPERKTSGNLNYEATIFLGRLQIIINFNEI